MEDAIDMEHQKPLVHLLLLPCPFCSKYPIFVRWHGGGKEKRHIMCRNLRCNVAPNVTGETPRQAASRWNKRDKQAAKWSLGFGFQNIRERYTDGAW